MTTDWKDILAGLASPTDESPDSGSDKGAADIAVEKDKSSAHPTLTIFYEKKGRAGKPATILSGFVPDSQASLNEAEQLAATLKKRLGCGGSARGGEILLQGDRREQLRLLLPKLNFTKIKG